MIDAAISSVIGACSGALFAFLLNAYHWKRQKQVEQMEKISSAVTELIDNFSTTATQYWLSNSLSKETEKALEIKIKSQVALLGSQIRDFRTAYSRKITSSNSIVMQTQIDSLFDISTGGTFEAKNRKSDVAIANKINTLCVKLKTSILKVSMFT